jgi:hypothetical protein
MLMLEPTEAEYKKAWSVITVVESERNPNAYRKEEGAVGIAQIRQAYLTDSGVKATLKDMYDPAISYKVYRGYMKRYKPQSYEEIFRLHNGGPGWKIKRHLTEKYMTKIRIASLRLSSAVEQRLASR